MSNLPWYKREPRAFLDATLGWNEGLKNAYSVILDLIYMHGNKVPDDNAYISAHIGCTKNKWTMTYRKELLMRGKVSIVDGYILNPRASKERKTENAEKQNLSKTSAKPEQNHTHVFYENVANSMSYEPIDKEVDIDTTSPSINRVEGGGEKFNLFWSKYPRTAGQSTARALAQWRGLTDAEQDHAIDAIAKLDTVFRKMDGGGFMPFVYLRDRVFEQSPKSASISSIAPDEGTEERRLFDLVGPQHWRNWFDRGEIVGTTFRPRHSLAGETIRERFMPQLARLGLDLEDAA